MRRAFTQPMTRNAWAILALILLAFSISAWATKPLIDFHVFHTAATRALGGEALYRESDGDMPFKYAPVIAILIAPMGSIPERAAAFLWLVATALLLIRFIDYARARYFPEAPVWATALVVFFVLHFHRHLLELGQCDVLILALAAESEIQRARRPLLSGALLALTCLFKPPFLLFAALALLFREGKRLAAFGAALAVGAVVPILRYGFDGNLEQLHAWRETLARTTSPMFCALDNQSVFGLVCRYLAPAESSGAGAARRRGDRPAATCSGRRDRR
ncbi:MAG: glycosyltransferase family 87 protein, partial [Myxococcaceae bacterium]